MSEAADFLSPVAGGRVSDQIVTQITALIHGGTLSPGDRLPPERVLADRFGVSRVTVRDALRVLEVQGLLRIKVGALGGAFVTAPSAAVLGEGLEDLIALATLSADEVAEARLVMELGILDLALQRATPEDIAELRAICARGKAAIADGTYDPEMSSDFHARLAQAAHNDTVVQISASFRGPLRMANVRAREHEPFSKTVQDHEQILDAIERGERQAARALMAHHLTRGLAIKALADELAAGPPPFADDDPAI
jgi:GntR family transcriptional regulator, transcriptional repressor for pyruvate dehydrogenase complex